MKVKSTNPALRQKLQGLMDQKSIPHGDVDQLMQDPARLKTLLDQSGSQFDTDTRRALEQVIGGDAQGKTSPAPSAAFAKSGAQSPFALQVDQATKSRASGDGDGAPADGGWWTRCDAQLPAPLFAEEAAKAAKVGDQTLSQADVTQMLRDVGAQPAAQWAADAPAVSAKQIAQILKGLDAD